MSAEVMKSKFVRCPSSVHLSSMCGINYLWSYCMDFFQILVVVSPGPHTQTFYEFLRIFFWFFYEYFSFSLPWDPMGAKTSKGYSSLKSFLNHFKLFLKFLLSGCHKSTLWDFYNLGFLSFHDFFSFSLTWQNFKRYSSLISFLNPIKLFLKFLLSGPHKSAVLDFWIVLFFRRNLKKKSKAL